MIMRKAFEKYVRLNPEDRRRTTVYASEATIKSTRSEALGTDDETITDGTFTTIFGMPLKVDDAVPYGDWRFMIEME
jgi:hypothetical protein